MRTNNLKGSAILAFTAFIWGIAFTAQSSAAEALPPFTINSLRSLISALFLFLLRLFVTRKKPEKLFPTDPVTKKAVISGGIVCGFLLAVSVNFQQFGIAFYPQGAATEAHAGFITALYVIIVPLISIITKKKVPAVVWLAAAIAIGGFYMLCLADGFDGVYLGDLLVLVCAVSFSLHIMAVDKYVSVVGGIRLSLLQFLVCGVISGLLAVFFELPEISLQGLMQGAPAVIYLGVVSSGIGYTLQIVGQSYAEPAIASIVMSLESVFAALGGWVISGNSLTVNEFTGCALVFAAIITAQLPSLKKKKQ